MAVAELIQRLAGKADQAERGFDELAVAVVEGEKVTDKQIESTCADAGKSVKQFAARLAILNRRREAVQAYQSRDWGAEIQKHLDEMRAKRRRSNELVEEGRRLMDESREANEQSNRSCSAADRVRQEQSQAREAMTGVLPASGGVDSWKDVTGAVHADEWGDE